MSAVEISGAVLLAVSFLGVSLLTRQVVQRLRLVERIAATQAQHVRQLQALNQRIVERMQSGVLVIDARQQVLLVNLHILIADHIFLRIPQGFK